MVPIFDVNEGAGTATLQLYSGGVPLTSFTYGNGMVTIAARPNPVTLTLPDLAVQLDTIAQWLGFVSDKLSPVATPLGQYDAGIKKKANGTIVGTYVVQPDDLMLTKVKCDAGSNEADFDPRPAYTFAWSDFLRWQRFFREYLRDCGG